MSRRASLLAKSQLPKVKPKVRFPDELVFLDNVRENDIKAMDSMLRRASLAVDINALGDSGMAPLHEAAMNGNVVAVQMLIKHGADPNRKDADLWTPLHAACANGNADVVQYLLDNGADITIITGEGERPIDLIEDGDDKTRKVLTSFVKRHESTKKKR